MNWLNNLEFEIEFRLREIIGEHGLMATDNPKIARLCKNLAAVKKLKEATYKEDECSRAPSGVSI
jgi:hypothetical protein